MKKPNILMITCDQLRLDSLSCYGNRAINTPNIDSIAKRGVAFDNHFCQNPLCSPSRATMITGRYPRSHGLRDNGFALADSETTLAEVLKANGYITAATGKMHFVPELLVESEACDEDSIWPEDRYGFDVRHLTDDKKTGSYLNDLKKQNPEAYEMAMQQGREKVKEDLASAAERKMELAPQLFKSALAAEFHQTTWIADKTIEFLKGSVKSDRPFFAWCSFVDPHHPFDPPAPYDTMYDPEKMPLPIRGDENEFDDKPPHFKKMLLGTSVGNERYCLRDVNDTGWRTVIARYYGMIKLIDDNIGRILDTLDEEGILDHTVIMFTSDHGELLGDHRLLFKGAFHYDSLIRLPMIVSWPEKISQGARSKEITQHTDLMPTLLEIAGIEAPQGVQGRSFFSLLKGQRDTGYEFALVEHDYSDWGMSIKTLRSKQWRFTYYAGENYGEMYNLCKDPGEITNLWDHEEYRDVKEWLKNKLIDKLVLTEDGKSRKLARY